MIIGVSVERLRESGVTPNEAFYLWRLKIGEVSSDSMVNTHFLSEMGYIDKDGSITDVGVGFVDDVFLPIKTTVTAPITLSGVKELSEKYRELFPKGVLTGGIPVRGNLKNVEAKMIVFKKTYKDYSDEVILKATEKYIKEKAKEGYGYMMMSEYLIMKNGKSTLASLCDAYKEGNGEERGSKWGRTV